MLSSGEDEIRLVPCAEIVAESMRLAGNQVHCIAMKSFVKVAHEVMYIVPQFFRLAAAKAQVLENECRQGLNRLRKRPIFR
jgi:hypothetical protein